MKAAEPFFDLHLHSSYSSDGEWSVERLFAEAERLGMIGLGVSDHDTLAALAHRPAMERRFPSVEWIPNVEISSGYQGRELHLLAPFVDPESPALARLLQRIHGRRDDQARGRMERLSAAGVAISEEEVRQLFGDLPLTGPAIARAVLNKYRSNPPAGLLPYLEGEKKEQAEASFYGDFFAKGRPAYVAKKELDIDESIATVRSAGGVPVLAHPGARFTEVDKAFIAKLRDIGLLGLEVYTSYHDEEKTRYYLDAALVCGLIPTAGSDFHGRAKPKVAFGCIRQGTRASLDELRSRSQPVPH